MGVAKCGRISLSTLLANAMLGWSTSIRTLTVSSDVCETRTVTSVFQTSAAMATVSWRLLFFSVVNSSSVPSATMRITTLCVAGSISLPLPVPHIALIGRSQ